MKLLIAFVQKEDTAKLLRRVREANVSVTSVDSAGGFLRKRNTTIFAALPDEKLQEVIAMIKDVCQARTERVDTIFATGDLESVGLPTPTEIPVGGATVLVLEITDVVKI